MTITQKNVDDAIELWIKRRLSLEDISAYFFICLFNFSIIVKNSFWFHQIAASQQMLF